MICFLLFFIQNICCGRFRGSKTCGRGRKNDPILVSMYSRRLVEARVSNFSRGSNVLHSGSVAEGFAEAVLTSNQIGRNKNHHSKVYQPFISFHNSEGMVGKKWKIYCTKVKMIVFRYLEPFHPCVFYVNALMPCHEKLLCMVADLSH